MTLRLARTNAEAHLYMELTPCQVCGATEFAPDHAVIAVDGDLASQYAGSCPQCDTPREFVFRIPAEVIIPDPEEPTFGDDRPSELLDAGQWLALADLFASGAPAEPTPQLSADQRRQARHDLRLAAAAIAEVCKFIPADEESVPAERFWSEPGRLAFEQEPGRFQRRRLAVVQQTYQQLAERFPA
ncbi:hypothetical protein JQS43_02885 [Natronosporangium hydrolyticum]|uniref:Uncharacterized protein n=1 Tax=Natronosporangium hydrolyticum TaxID=2811111 RepID=A0A895YKY8_9ACTN|nr:hypothetical protein [Natronosporangium hydrolyticum]QSB15326.1 hypothetical protein JQS43_02885 [Natronosporangium hydrolyticum]